MGVEAIAVLRDRGLLGFLGGAIPVRSWLGSLALGTSAALLAVTQIIDTYAVGLLLPATPPGRVRVA